MKFIVFLSMAFVFCAPPIAAETLDNAAQIAFSRGDLEGAAAQWEIAAKQAADSKPSLRHAQILAFLGATYQAMGRFEAALENLEMARDEAIRLQNPALLALVQNNLGSAYTFTRAFDAALVALDASLKAAPTDGAKALALNNLAILQSLQESNDAAQKSYGESRELAEKAGDNLLVARVSTNLAALMARGEDSKAAQKNAEFAFTQLETLPDSRDKTRLFLALGHIYRLLASEESFKRAAQLDEMALQAARRLKDPRTESEALGYLGELAELKRENETALRLTRQARFLAQNLQSPALLYRWEWQIGRILAAQNQTDEAIAALRRSVETLKTLGECASGAANDSLDASFRDSAAPLYYQLADLLLQRSKTAENTAQQALLVEARDTIESLKGAEISDYFQDPCVAAAQARAKDVDALLQNAAVIYFIPLQDRTEILLGLQNGLQRFSSPVGAQELTAKIRRMRFHLERPNSQSFLPYSRQIYDWLLQPIQPTLDAQKVSTLIFVPDGALRTAPMAALHDGTQFLIEKYSLAVTPGVTLMDPRPLERRDPRVLAGGVSQSVQGFPALDSVPEELADIARIYPSTELLNGQFQRTKIQSEVSEGRYSIVHIASHGEFGGNPMRSFLLTFDGKLNMNDLEEMIRPRQYRGAPVELLFLSACQSASGDDRAALGLAGVALKSGARSALATLWSVNDDATAELSTEFYTALKNHPDFSKAEALRAAQLALLKDEKFAHPAFWSPYLLVGNWF